MVGTRHITDYGRTICDRFIRELREICPDVLIISGLAYGVDIHSHRAALANGMATIGVWPMVWTASIRRPTARRL
jgi:DNA processing protein